MRSAPPLNVKSTPSQHGVYPSQCGVYPLPAWNVPPLNEKYTPSQRKVYPLSTWSTPLLNLDLDMYSPYLKLDVTTVVKCMLNVITADKYSFMYNLRGILFPLFFVALHGVLSKYKVQTRIHKSKQRTSTLTKWEANQGPWCSLDLLVDALSFLKISKDSPL